MALLDDHGRDALLSLAQAVENLVADGLKFLVVAAAVAEGTATEGLNAGASQVKGLGHFV